MLRRTPLALATLFALAISGFTSNAAADSEACRDWRVEHYEWKVEALQAFLRSRPRAAQDETVFEMLQREAYLTSCEPELRATRKEMIGWRLVGRSADEYPVVLTESVLTAGGFDLELPALQRVGSAQTERGRRRRGPRSVALGGFDPLADGRP